MKKNIKTLSVLLGLAIAFLLFYTNTSQDIPSPQFSYSLKVVTQSVTYDLTGHFGEQLVNHLNK